MRPEECQDINPEPIQIKLTKGTKKADILKSTKNRGTNIWINEDYSKEILQQRVKAKIKESQGKRNKSNPKIQQTNNKRLSILPRRTRGYPYNR